MYVTWCIFKTMSNIVYTLGQNGLIDACQVCDFQKLNKFTREIRSTNMNRKRRIE